MPYTDEKIGYQKNDASKEAASFNKNGKITIREQVLELFHERKELTVEQVSNCLQVLRVWFLHDGKARFQVVVENIQPILTKVANQRSTERKDTSMQ